jgi:hypothetical protein
MLRPEVIRIWTVGMEVVDVSEFSSLERGCKIARAALVADDSNYWVACKTRRRNCLPAYQREYVRGPVLDGMSKFVVVKADMSQINFQEVLF